MKHEVEAGEIKIGQRYTFGKKVGEITFVGREYAIIKWSETSAEHIPVSQLLRLQQVKTEIEKL